MHEMNSYFLVYVCAHKQEALCALQEVGERLASCVS